MFIEDRGPSDPPAVIVDIDGTVITFDGTTRVAVVDALNAFDGSRIVVTGRSEDDRQQTVEDLRRAGLRYSALKMNPGGSNIDHKRATAAELLTKYDIAYAVDDDPAARSAYRDLGITARTPGDVAQDAPDGRTAQMKVEQRSITIDDFELRSAEDGMSFSGYAAVFDSPSQPLPFVESIAPGAFSRTLKARNNVRMLLNHDTSRVLGTTRAKTLRLAEDSKGLHVEADLPDTSYGRDLSVSMRRGDVDSMSFGFSVPKGGDTWNGDGSQRTLLEVRLHEVSVVTFPAYEATSAQVRDYSALASRAQADEDAIASAMEALIDGSLTQDQADLLRSVVDQAAPKPEPSTSVPMSVLQKQLDLIAKSL